MTFDEKMAAAKKRVAAMDETDRGRDRYLKTIVAALRTGLRYPDTGAAYDALVMLEDRILADDE